MSFGLNLNWVLVLNLLPTYNYYVSFKQLLNGTKTTIHILTRTGKGHEAQPYTKSYKQLKNAESRRNNLPAGNTIHFLQVILFSVINPCNIVIILNYYRENENEIIHRNA